MCNRWAEGIGLANCRQCGAQVTPEASYCPSCGTRITKPGAVQLSSVGLSAPPVAPPPAVLSGTVPVSSGRQATAVAPKNPALSLIVSIFLPGVGSMMNGDVGKGVGILVGYFVSLFLFWLLIPLFIAFALWIWGLIDAYTGAQKWNLAHGVIS